MYTAHLDNYIRSYELNKKNDYGLLKDGKYFDGTGTKGLHSYRCGREGNKADINSYMARNSYRFYPIQEELKVSNDKIQNNKRASSGKENYGVKPKSYIPVQNKKFVPIKPRILPIPSVPCISSNSKSYCSQYSSNFSESRDKSYISDINAMNYISNSQISTISGGKRSFFNIASRLSPLSKVNFLSQRRHKFDPTMLDILSEDLEPPEIFRGNNFYTQQKGLETPRRFSAEESCSDLYDDDEVFKPNFKVPLVQISPLRVGSPFTIERNLQSKFAIRERIRNTEKLFRNTESDYSSEDEFTLDSSIQVKNDENISMLSDSIDSVILNDSKLKDDASVNENNLSVEVSLEKSEYSIFSNSEECQDTKITNQKVNILDKLRDILADSSIEKINVSEIIPADSGKKIIEEDSDHFPMFDPNEFEVSTNNLNLNFPTWAEEELQSKNEKIEESSNENIQAIPEGI